MARAPAPPPCRQLGGQCVALPVTIRASADVGDPRRGDHEATWLFGHTERIEFGRMWRWHGELFVKARLRIPCKHLQVDGDQARCRVWDYTGPVPVPPAPRVQPRRLGNGRFRIVDRSRVADLPLQAPPPRPRSLPVADDNPCATAPCRTADHTRGSACCRDLQIEIMCDEAWTRQEALVRSRKSPYLCKVHRDSPESLEAEVISACGYLADDGILCTLHGRRRPDGRQAKPGLCRRWPKPTTDETLHPGCVYAIPGPDRV